MGPFGVFCQFIEPDGVSVQKRSHLINKGSGAARAGFVHAKFNALCEVNDFGVFAAQFHGNIQQRIIFMQVRPGCHHFLHKSGACCTGKDQSARA